MNWKTITNKIIGLGLISTLFLSGCQFFPSKSQSNNSQSPDQINNPQLNVDNELTNKLESLQLNFTNFRAEVESFNQNLAKIAKKQTTAAKIDFTKVNQSSKKLNQAINDLQKIVENNPVNNQAILKQNLREIETLLASINKVIQPLNNGLGKTEVTQVQKYLNFFPRRGISPQVYGNFGQITQIEIQNFLTQKNQKIVQSLTILDSNILAKNSPIIQLPSELETNNNSETLTDSDKIINLEKKQQKLQKDFNEFTEDIKESLFTLIVIFFIFILLTSIILILIIYKPISNESGNNFEQGNKQKKSNLNQQFSEYQTKFQKQDQQIKQINQYLNQFEEQFKQVGKYINQIEEILIKQMSQRLANLENSQKSNFSQVKTPPTNLISPNLNPSLPTVTNLSPNVTTINLAQPEITSEEQLLEIYNSNQINLLISQAVLVAESLNTMNKRREGRDIIPIFEINKRGDFWLINIQTKYYLLPRNDFQLNEFSYKILTVVFYCNNDNLQFTKFKVIKPAQVIKTNQGWELIDIGELNFY